MKVTCRQPSAIESDILNSLDRFRKLSEEDQNELVLRAVENMKDLVSRAFMATTDFWISIVKEVRRFKAGVGYPNKKIVPIILEPDGVVYYLMLVHPEARRFIEHMAGIEISGIIPPDQVDVEMFAAFMAAREGWIEKKEQLKG